MQCYFAFLSIDMFVLFNGYSLRYLSLKLDISSIKLLLLYRVCGICSLSAHPSKADKGHRSLSEAI